MLLIEILSKTHPDIAASSRPMYRTNDLEIYPPKKWNDVGVGQQSKVYANDRQPNNVVKLTMAYTGKEDPAYQFLRLCLSHQDNPFFPKIYNVKQYPAGDETKLIISMEKLTQLDSTDFEKLQQLFGIPFELDSTGETVSGGIFDCFTKSSIRQYMITNTKSVELKKALKLLEPLFRHYSPDMHLGNIMKRGSQFVFIDPISY